jgi:hypothetical protein
MEPMYYIGLHVHKRKISYCVKDSSGKLHSEGPIPATRFDLDRWMKRFHSRGVRNESDHVYRVDLRSFEAACCLAEGGASLDAAGHRGYEKEERPHRRQQDIRLPARRFPLSAPWRWK